MVSEMSRLTPGNRSGALTRVDGESRENGRGRATGWVLSSGETNVNSLLFIDQASGSETSLVTKVDFRQHISEFLLNQLILRERIFELYTLQRVLSRLLEAELGCSQSTPSDAVSRIIQTAEGPL